MSMRPGCSYRQRSLFTDPGAEDDPATEWAKQICATCPVRTACARQALTAGSSLDWHHRAPATGVIQAGVYCDGSNEATEQLALIAGVDPGRVTQRRGRDHPDDVCTNCGRPMVRWRRGEVPAGYVMHYARGYCTGCRVAYREKYPPGQATQRRRDEGGLEE